MGGDTHQSQGLAGHSGGMPGGSAGRASSPSLIRKVGRHGKCLRGWGWGAGMQGSRRRSGQLGATWRRNAGSMFTPVSPCRAQGARPLTPKLAAALVHGSGLEPARHPCRSKLTPAPETDGAVAGTQGPQARTQGVSTAAGSCTGREHTHVCSRNSVCDQLPVLRTAALRDAVNIGLSLATETTCSHG